MKSDLTRDPACVDTAFPPEMHPFFIEGRILGLAYVADGRGPHATLVFLHGFPGNEKNLDIAHMLRRGGVNVVIFHYSGSWGSRGTYSFGQAYRDLQSVHHAISRDAFAQEHRIDRNNVFLAGHSVGGFLALLAARDSMKFRGIAALAPYNLSLQAKRIDAGEKDAFTETSRLFSEGLDPLNGATAESLVTEIIENRHAWDLLGDDSPYSGKNMLLVIAASDTIAEPSRHQIPVAEMMRRVQGLKAVVSLPCSHDFSEKRITLAETLYDWIKC